MLGRLLTLLFLFFSVSAWSQSATQEKINIKDIDRYILDDVEVNTTGEEATRSFIGQSFDQEVEQEQIKKNQSSTVSEILDQIPGADNLGGPRKEAQNISIRGFQGNQVLLLLDGTRNNFSMTHNSIIPVRMHLLKRIDVIKGGASSRFGNGALGGLMSFSTIDAYDLVPGGSEHAAQMRGMYSDVSAQYQNSMTAGTVFGKKRARGLVVDVTQTQAKDIELSDNRALAYSGFEDQSVWAKANYEVSKNNHLWISAEEYTKDSRTPDNPGRDDTADNEISDMNETYQSFKIQYKRSGNSRVRPEFILYQSINPKIWGFFYFF